MWVFRREPSYFRGFFQKVSGVSGDVFARRRSPFVMFCHAEQVFLNPASIEMDQVVLGHPIAQVRRQEHRGVTVYGDKSGGHGSKLLNFRSASKSDRFLAVDGLAAFVYDPGNKGPFGPGRS